MLCINYVQYTLPGAQRDLPALISVSGMPPSSSALQPETVRDAVSGQNGDGLMIGLHDLQGPFQP